MTGKVLNRQGAVFRGVDDTARWLKKEHARSEKSMETAIKVEGFRLRRRLKTEIRKGAPGGRQLEPLSYIARRAHRSAQGGGRISPNRKPLSRLALGVRYDVQTRPAFAFKVGWVGPKVSKSWKRLAKMHQEGFTRDITRAQREFMARRGGNLGTVEGGDTPFFLRKSTRYFHTPARPIMEPFWQAHEDEALRNINRNFGLKLKGQRI